MQWGEKGEGRGGRWERDRNVRKVDRKDGVCLCVCVCVMICIDLYVRNYVHEYIKKSRRILVDLKKNRFQEIQID